MLICLAPLSPPGNKESFDISEAELFLPAKQLALIDNIKYGQVLRQGSLLQSILNLALSYKRYLTYAKQIGSSIRRRRPWSCLMRSWRDLLVAKIIRPTKIAGRTTRKTGAGETSRRCLNLWWAGVWKLDFDKFLRRICIVSCIQQQCHQFRPETQCRNPGGPVTPD